MKKIIIIIIAACLFYSGFAQNDSNKTEAVKIQIGAYGGLTSIIGVEMGFDIPKFGTLLGFTEVNLYGDPSIVLGLTSLTNWSKKHNSGMILRTGIATDFKAFFSLGYYNQLELSVFYIRPQFEVIIYNQVGFNIGIAAGLKL